MIQVLDWLYENELRAYPLRESSIKASNGSYSLENNVILDAQFSMEERPETLALIGIVVDGNDVTFSFSDGPDVTVQKGITAPLYTRSSDSLLVFGLGLNDIPEGTHNFTNLNFESSVIFEYGGAWKGVESMTFNDSDALTGELNFIEGYQFELFVVNQNIRFAVGNLYGTPIGCNKFTDYPENCDTIISSINGVGPSGKKELFLKAGNGFVVWDDPDNHRIYVGFAFTSQQDICADIPPFLP